LTEIDCGVDQILRRLAARRSEVLSDVIFILIARALLITFVCLIFQCRFSLTAFKLKFGFSLFFCLHHFIVDTSYSLWEYASLVDCSRPHTREFKMKIPKDLYKDLEKAIWPVLHTTNGNSVRQRWDALWLSKYDVSKLYDAGLNDDHIDTALRSIFRI